VRWSVLEGRGANLLTNAGFEATPAFAAWSIPDVPAVSWALDTVAWAPEAAHSARMTVTDPTFNGNPGHWGNLIQVVNRPGYEGPWTGSAWIKAPAGRSIGLGLIKYYDDGAGGSVAPWQPGYPTDALSSSAWYHHVTATGDWQRVVWSIPADPSVRPSYAVDFRAGIGGDAGGWQAGDQLWLDAAQLELGDRVTGWSDVSEHVALFDGVIGAVTSSGGPFDPAVTLTAYDTPVLLGVETDAPVAPDLEACGTRLSRLAAECLIPYPELDIENDPVMLVGGSASNYANAWADAVDGAGGVSFTTGEGVLTYRSRAFYGLNPGSRSVQQSLEVAEHLTAGIGQPSALGLEALRDRVRNDVMLTGGDDTAPITARATDTASIQRHGRVTDVATLLTADAGVLDQLARIRLDTFGEVRRNLPALEVPVYDSASASTVRRRFGDRVHLSWSDDPAPWDYDAIVTGVAHDVSQGAWTITLLLAQAHGVTDLGARWGVARWGVDSWVSS